MTSVLASLESIVIGSVAITARALTDAAVDLTFLQWRALIVVGAGNDRVAVGEIATRIGATSSATSRLVGRLERRGLVARDRGADDRRVTHVRLTPAGRRLRGRVIRSRARDLRTVATAPTIPSAAALDAIAREFERLG